MYFSNNDSTLFVAKSDLFIHDFGSSWLSLGVPATEGQEMDLDFLAVHETDHHVWLTGRNLSEGGAVVYRTQNGEPLLKSIPCLTG